MHVMLWFMSKMALSPSADAVSVLLERTATEDAWERSVPVLQTQTSTEPALSSTWYSASPKCRAGSREEQKDRLRMLQSPRPAVPTGPVWAWVFVTIVRLDGSQRLEEKKTKTHKNHIKESQATLWLQEVQGDKISWNSIHFFVLRGFCST